METESEIPNHSELVQLNANKVWDAPPQSSSL